MADLANRAIEGNKEAFSDFRKLTACGVMLSTGEDSTEAAVAADKSVFQKRVEYLAGEGEMAASDAVSSLIDRGAAHLSTFLHTTVKTAVENGCRVAGTWLGSFFGPAGMKVGCQIGEKVAEVLNTNVSVLINKGVEKIKSVAKSWYEKGKAFLSGAVTAVKSFVSGAVKIFSGFFS